MLKFQKEGNFQSKYFFKSNIFREWTNAYFNCQSIGKIYTLKTKFYVKKAMRIGSSSDHSDEEIDENPFYCYKK